MARQTPIPSLNRDKPCFLTPAVLAIALSSLIPVAPSVLAHGQAADHASVTVTNTIEQPLTDPWSHGEADRPYQQPLSIQQAARFMTQATFGPTRAEVIDLMNSSPSQWFVDQLSMPASHLMPTVEAYAAQANPALDSDPLYIESTTFGFWKNSITGPDQLRQRMAFALSQLLVVSNGGGETLTDIPEAVARYQDLLIDYAFANYRDLLETITYAPAMGHYLTFMGSEKADPDTGRMPDENYARELLQLFTIGLTELNSDGTERLDSQGNSIETYTNQDITGLARVFTGLDLDLPEGIDDDNEENDDLWKQAWTRPLKLYSDAHSDQEKAFLGHTIAENTSGQASITMALDMIFDHPNIAPFISKQLIQRLVTSNPSPAYVQRVAQTFEIGQYTLPDGQQVGEGRKGDLSATLAAILFDHEAATPGGAGGGKVREPILRLTHWARVFDVQNITPEYQWLLWDTSQTDSLFQHPYRAPSVFNFYRPGYTVPGSSSADYGLVAPELQLVNAGSVTGYINFMTEFLLFEPEWINVDELQAELDEEGIQLNAENALTSFTPDYQLEREIASDIEQLLDYLDLKLTFGTLTAETRSAIADMLQDVPLDDGDTENGGAEDRVRLAILMIMTSPDYLVQR